jgi:type IV pilus assembly protein PilN
MVRINLLPVRVSKKKEAGKQQLVIFAVILAAGLAINYAWASARGSELKSRQQKVARTREDIAQLERIIGEVRNIKEQQQSLQQKLDVLDRLKAGRTGPVRMLDELATVMPRQLWLSKMDEKGGAVTLTGTAVSIDDVSAFMTALKNSKYFTKVELKKTVATAPASGAAAGAGLLPDRLVGFDITATAQYGPAPAAPGEAAPKGKG